MALKIHKILFIFLLTITFVSCAGDDDDEPGSSNEAFDASPGSSGHEEGFVIGQPWWLFAPSVASDTVQISDTLAEFPTQESFTTKSVAYVFGFQRLASDIVSQLFALPADSENKWMNFFTSNLGTFVSLSDSRPKQWQLDYDAEYQGKVWPYHLEISDLPDGSPDGKTNKAIDFFYDGEYKNGILFFAPQYLNPVMYPEKVMGHGMKCSLYFSSRSGVLENILSVSNFADDGRPNVYGNVYLYTRKYSNAISFASIVDMPHLWFGKKEDIGYSVLMIGGIDCAISNMAVSAALCPNTTTNNLSESLIREYGVEKTMPKKCRQWNVVSGCDTIYEYQTPAFMNSNTYIGAGREVPDRTVFSKALSVMEDAKILEYQLSPYKVSIQQIEQ